MNHAELKKLVEAALMVLAQPLSISDLLSMFEDDPEKPDRNEVRKALNELQEDYAERGVELKEVASGFRFQARSDYAQWINRLFDERPQRYSQALLETLAIIAYQQPVTRGEIENIRGVSLSTGIVRTLFEREWIKVVGHRDAPGHPELLATTKQFLDYFNLKELAELPSLGEIKDFDQIEPDLFESVDQAPNSELLPAPEAAHEGAAEGVFEESNIQPARHSLFQPARQWLTEFKKSWLLWGWVRAVT